MTVRIKPQAGPNPRRRRSRSAFGGIAVVLLLIGGLLAACTPASTVLSGIVTDGGGSSETGVAVRVYDNTSETLVATTLTDDSGHYAFTNHRLVDGSYRIRFGDADWNAGAATWAGATPVPVSVATPATLNDTYTEAPGTISGTVTTASDATPLQDATIDVVDAAGNVVDTESSEPNGTWQSIDLMPGPYTVRFVDDGYATVYNGAVSDPTAVPSIEVPVGGTVSGIDAALTGGASITVSLGSLPSGSDLYGGVIDATTGHVIDYRSLNPGEGEGEGEGEGGDVTDFSGLKPGTYRFEIVDLASVISPWVYGTTTGNLEDGTVIGLSAGDNLTLGDTDVILQTKACSALGSAPDLSGQDLSGRNYLNCDLSGADLSGANLFGTVLDGANLTGADLSGAIIDASTSFQDANLSGVNLTGTDLSNLSNYGGVSSGGIIGTPSALGAGQAIVDGYFIADGVDLDNAALDNANLSGLSLQYASLDDASLSSADLRGTDLSGVVAQGANFTAANLASDGTNSADLSSADLTNAIFDNATLDAGTTFVDATLTGTSWTGVSLAAQGAGLSGITTGGITNAPSALPTGWKFYGGYFVGPNVTLNGADLSGIDLTTDVDLTNTAFVGTNLTGANLSGLDLSGKRITNCNLTNSTFTNVIVSSTTQLDNDRFTGATMTGTNLIPMTPSNFYGVSSGNVTAPPTLHPNWVDYDGYFIGPYADLDNADFSGVDLSGANLSTTSVNGAIFGTATMTSVQSAGITGTPASLPTGWFVAGSGANGERYLAGPYANLTGAVFAEVDMSNTDLSNANLTNAKFLYDVNITGMNLAGATLTGLTSEVTGTPAALPAGWVTIDDAGGHEHLIGPGAYVYGAYTAIDFHGVDLHGLDLAGATFRSTNLSHANLIGSDLSGASFPYADLSYATVTSANMSGADLNHANLTAVDFSVLSPNPIDGTSAQPFGASTATFSATICPNGVNVTSPDSCMSRGFLG